MSAQSTAFTSRCPLASFTRWQKASQSATDVMRMASGRSQERSGEVPGSTNIRMSYFRQGREKSSTLVRLSRSSAVSS